MTEKILVAVDGRAAGDRAVAWTAARAVRHPSAVTIFQAVDTPPGPIGTRDHHAAMQRVAEQIARAATATVAAADDRIEVASRIEDGDAVDLLERVSAGFDLLVVGTNGRGGPFGPSTRAVRIAATAACPVVVVPDTTLEDRHDVVVGIDGSESSQRALAFAAAEADATGQTLVAVTTWRLPPYLGYDYAWPVDISSELATDAELRAADELAAVQAQYPQLVIRREAVQGGSAEVLVEASETAALTVVGSRGLGPVRRLLLGSVSQAVVQHTRGPIAVIR